MPLSLDPRYQVLNERQLAEMLGVGTSTLQRWRVLGMVLTSPTFSTSHRLSALHGRAMARRARARARKDPSPHDGLNR